MIYNYTYKLYYFIVHKLNENDSIFLFYSNTWFSTDFLYIDFVTNQFYNKFSTIKTICYSQFISYLITRIEKYLK